MIESSYKKLSEEYKELLDAAERALKNSYNPYSSSKVKIAAAVRTNTGEIITGSSYVNSSSPSSVCAEKAAIITANSLGKKDLRAMAIIGTKERGIKNPITPCGNCRQVMQEAVNISSRDFAVVCSNDDKSRILITSVKELLPFPYVG